MDGLHLQVLFAVDGLLTHAEGALLNEGIHAHGGQDSAQACAAGTDALGQGALGQQIDLQSALGILLTNLGSHAHMGGDDALDLMIVDQLGDPEEFLALGAGGTTHIIGDEGQILGAQLHQLLDDSTSLAASQKATAHNGGAIGNHFCCLCGSQYRFLCHFYSSLLM